MNLRTVIKQASGRWKILKYHVTFKCAKTSRQGTLLMGVSHMSLPGLYKVGNVNKLAMVDLILH